MMLILIKKIENFENENHVISELNKNEENVFAQLKNEEKFKFNDDIFEKKQ